MTSGVQAHGFSYSGVRPVIIAGHTPENLGFRTQFQLPVGTSTLGGRPGDFDKSFVEGQVVPENKPEKLVFICVFGSKLKSYHFHFKLFHKKMRKIRERLFIFKLNSEELSSF